MHRHSSVNRLYRLVWNDALMIWTAVAEIARGRGKSGTGRRRMTALLALNAGFVLGPPATAGPNNIQPDGRTQTTVSASGGATSVHTSTTSGSNAFNSFSTFAVGGGQVVNMHLPGGSANLINMVTDSRVTINGMLNSIKGNKIGGNVFFASPHGFLVGSGGVVNVGSLTVSTPTRSFLDTFFTDTGDIDALSVGALLDGSAPDEGGAITIDGTVNAMGGVRFRGGSVRISGTVYRGAKFVGLAPDFSDVVNVNGLAAGTKIVEVDGRIQVVAEDDPAAAVTPVASAAEEDSENQTGSVDIQASQDVSVSGVIRNEGSEGVSGGQIAIQAGNNITLESGANISAAGLGNNSSGGTVYMMAANSAVAQTGALVNTSAGATGDGGAIEFSARKNVELAGGQFRASSTTGTMGTVLIDPETVTVSADYYSGGANHNIVADNTITVNAGVVVSTRNVDGGDTANQTTAASVGNSGNLNLQAGSITLEAGSALVSHSDVVGFTGGDITINATRAPGGALGGGGNASITATGATIMGASVSVQAQSDYDDTGALVPLPLAIPSATASISLTDTAVSASGTLAIGAKASVDTSPLGDTPLAISVANSSATVNVAGTSVLSSTGNATLSAESTVTSNVKPTGLGLALPADAAVAISTINSTATVKVGGSSSVTTDAVLELSAKNTVEA
ncbi:MAG: leukotoxin LktA family filamentous adhesin, partial [Gammaproteobacteria bacterium]|nr:leukotoxin LktA family filamentous adhesin [Gammaproteobacteria bacterium]